MAEVKSDQIFNYIKQAGEAHAADSQSKLDIQKQLDAQEQASADAMVAATTVGGSQAVMRASEESWKAASDAKIAAMGEALGTDWTSQGSQTNLWAARMKENAEKAYSALDVVHEKEAKTLLNDPIGFIEAQFSLPSDIATYNYYAEKNNIAEGRLNELLDASNAAAVSIKQEEKRTSTEYATAKAEEAAALAAGNVAALKRQAAGDSISGIRAINELDSRQLQIALQVHAARNSDASLALQRQSQADSHAKVLFDMEQKRELLEGKQATEDDWRAQMEVRNIGAKARDIAPIESIGMFKQEYRIQSKNPVYQNLLTYGAQISFNKGYVNGVAVAENAGAAARDYSAGGVNLSNNPVGSYLAQVYATKKTDIGAMKDPAAFNEIVNKAAVGGAKKLASSIDNSNPNIPNIYAAPPPAIMLKSKAAAVNPFIVDTVVPMVQQNKNVTIPDAVMLAKAADYAKGGKANFNMAAAGIVDYYSKAVIENNNTKLYKENGLDPQLGYNARIDGRNIDLTNIVQVKDYLFKQNMATYTNSLTGAR